MFIKLKFTLILCLILNFINYSTYATGYNSDYYNRYIYSNIKLNNPNDIAKYVEDNSGEQFTIGCVSKSIFGTGVLLFSQDPKNEYLFRGKDLEITIGELLENRKNYLKSLKNPTQIQIDKLDFINKLMVFIDSRILNTEVYKVLNHTSIFADDFNKYLLYLLAQKIVNIFPEKERELLTLNMIQFLSSRETKEKEVKYSNMGFMYMIKIMSLMTDKENFYAEVNERILKPLKVEEKFIPIHILNREDLKNRFPNQNYYSKFKDRVVLIKIYDITYGEMDTLNGGLITDLDSVLKVTKEISKMYFGFKNVLTDNPELMSNLLFKYKTIYDKSKNELYSLGTYIDVLDNSLVMKMTGIVFGRRTIIEFFIDKIKDYENDKYNNYIYEPKNYKKSINNTAIIEITNDFLDRIFFSNINFQFNSIESKNILAKTIYNNFKDGEKINSEDVEWYINYNPKKLIKELKIEIDRNILESGITKEKQEELKKEFAGYFEKLREFLRISN